jgi:hypothetical protein
MDRQVLVSDRARGSEEKSTIIERVTGPMADSAAARPMTCGGSEVSGIIEGHSENIERTGKIRMGELDD